MIWVLKIGFIIAAVIVSKRISESYISGYATGFLVAVILDLIDKT